MEKELKMYLKKHNGYIETKNFKNIGIPKIYIPKFVQKSIIKKVAHGLYLDTNKFEDEYYIFQKRYSNTVFSYNTSFHLLNMTERTPTELEITTTRNNSIQNYPNLKIHYVTKEVFNLGVIEIDSPFGNKIKVYNKERCICDMIKNNEGFELELYNKILRNYMNSEDKDLNMLLEYAKKLKVYERVVLIMEVLME